MTQNSEIAFDWCSASILILMIVVFAVLVFVDIFGRRDESEDA